MKCSVLWKFNKVNPIIWLLKVEFLISYRQSMYVNETGQFKTKLNPRLSVIFKIFALGYTTEHTHNWPK